MYTIPGTDLRYRFINDWARVPATPTGVTNGRTHAVAVASTGEVVVFHQADPAVLVFSPEGTLISSWGDRFLGAHGMTLVCENGTDYLWLTDQHTGEVVKTTLAGAAVQRIDRPDLPVYVDGKYSPTWVAVNEVDRGGNGDVWVSDGYGTNQIHCFDVGGNYVRSIDGSAGEGGSFRTPHGIWFDKRSKANRELYVADNANQQIQVFDDAGRFLRVFGKDVVSSPRHGISYGPLLFVPELFGQMVVFGAHDEFVTYLGGASDARGPDGWPNQPLGDDKLTRFNSPHAMDIDREGNLFVVEWRVGGRIIKLERY